MEHAHREETGQETWDVQLVHPRPEEFAGTSELFARGDTLDLTKLYDLLCATAADLALVEQGVVHPSRDPSTAKTRLYLHLDPATMAKIRDWLAATNASIQPVLRMDRHDTTDAHDPPAWMRDLVTLRDPHCVFPYCQRTSRACDLDHISHYQDSYQDP